MAVSCIGTLYHRDLGSSRVGEVFCCSLTVTAGLVLPTPFSNCNRSLVMDFDTTMCALAHIINVTRLPKYGLFPLPCHPSTLTSKPLSHLLNPNTHAPTPNPTPCPLCIAPLIQAIPLGIIVGSLWSAIHHSSMHPSTLHSCMKGYGSHCRDACLLACLHETNYKCFVCSVSGQTSNQSLRRCLCKSPNGQVDVFLCA